jgi:hypothetical protein
LRNAISKEPWRFKYVDDQLNMFYQQWQAEQQKQIITKTTGKISGKSNDSKHKSSERNTSKNGGHSGGRHDNDGPGGRQWKMQ